MDIDQLKTFVAVYRLKGITPVAHSLSLAPSSISRSLASLEANLGVRLFNRTTRKVVPTEEGKTFYHQVSPLVEEFEAARAALQESATEQAGHLRVTCSVSFGQIAVVPLLKEFRERFPHIELELVLADRNVDLINEQIDIAIRHGKLNDSGLVARKLIDAQYKIVASPDYLKTVPPIRKPSDISKQSIVSFAFDGLRSEWQLTKSANRQTVAVSPKLILSNANSIRQCVVDGLGLALLADWTVEDELQNGSLVCVLPQWKVVGDLLGSSVWLVFPSGSFVPKKTRVFSEYLLEKLT